MFHINTITENNLPFIVLQNSDKSTYAKISLNEGGRLQELKCNDVFIIKDIPNFNYETSYASSVLFPFASRIKDGKYTFSGEEFQLNKNDNNISALHGLVYNKKFELFESKTNKQNCSVTVNYFENNHSQGFPFNYFISFIYTLCENSLQLKVDLKNTDKRPFPFTLGWHPYFFSNDLPNSSLNFKSNKKVVFDENLIAKEIVNYNNNESFTLNNKQLDDCFFLEDNKVSFSTSKYTVKISSNVKENFLQLFTPKNLPVIAIEPMTGISNSFNNIIGLRVLEPQKSYTITWDLNFEIK